MGSMFILSFFLLFSSCFFLGFCDDQEHLDQLVDTFQNTFSSQGLGSDLIKDAGKLVGDDPKMQCIQKLLPCQPYLHESSPPETCCLPLKEMVENETQCLCGVLTNPGIMTSFNVSEDDALKLAKVCGASADLSICKKAKSPSADSPPATPSTSHAAPPTGSSTSTANQNNAGTGIRHLAGSGFYAFFVGLIVWTVFYGLTT